MGVALGRRPARLALTLGLLAVVGSLPAVVERLRAEGINATQTDMDKIDFGDGYGPIDVIQGAYPGGGVAWQWLPRE